MNKLNVKCKHVDANKVAMLVSSLAVASRSYSFSPIIEDKESILELTTKAKTTFVNGDDLSVEYGWMLSPSVGSIEFTSFTGNELCFQTAMTLKALLEYGAFLSRLGFSVWYSLVGSNHVMKFAPNSEVDSSESRNVINLTLTTPIRHRNLKLRKNH